MDGDALVRDYLGRLDAASWPLSLGRRDELRAEMAEHIDAALAEAGARDEVTVRNVLERLGRPEEIVAADADLLVGAPPAMPAPQAASSPWGAVEILAILFLTLGILIPFVGPLIGLVFTWGSRQWTTREKVIATLIMAVVFVVIPLLGMAAFATSGAQGGTD